MLGPPIAEAFGADSSGGPFGPPSGPTAMECDQIGANCVVLNNSFAGGSYAASALFAPNVVFPNYVNPSVLASASQSSDTTQICCKFADATVEYYFEVYVPTTPSQIPPVIPVVVDLTAKGSVSTTGQSPFGQFADAELDIVNSNDLRAYYNCAGGGQSDCGTNPNVSSFSVVNQPLDIYANQLYLVYLNAVVEPTDFNSSVTASVDPFIGLDPSTLALFPDAELILSPGVRQSAVDTVPEPSTWAMMLVGFAGLAFVGYRRRSARLA